MYVLKALTDHSDAQIFDHLTMLRPGDTFWKRFVDNLAPILLANFAEDYCY